MNMEQILIPKIGDKVSSFHCSLDSGSCLRIAQKTPVNELKDCIRDSIITGIVEEVKADLYFLKEHAKWVSFRNIIHIERETPELDENKNKPREINLLDF